MMMAWPDWRT